MLKREESAYWKNKVRIRIALHRAMHKSFIQIQNLHMIQMGSIHKSVFGGAFALWRENSLFPIYGRKRVVGWKRFDENDAENQEKEKRQRIILANIHLALLFSRINDAFRLLLCGGNLFLHLLLTVVMRNGGYCLLILHCSIYYALLVDILDLFRSITRGMKGSRMEDETGYSLMNDDTFSIVLSCITLSEGWERTLSRRSTCKQNRANSTRGNMQIWT